MASPDSTSVAGDRLTPLPGKRITPLPSPRSSETRLRVLDTRPARDDELVVGAAFGEINDLVTLAAISRAPVLITGETGVGKNRVARAIHNRGPHRAAPFVTTNCAALPEHLIEGELFGYDKGAFTGAVGSKKGIFELAEGGTLLLDELGEVPMHLQTKLLGVLDDQQVRRLGSESVRRIDTRLIAATSADLEKALGKTFRYDLYYRLNVIRIVLPPLRERRCDIPALARHLLKKLNNGFEVECSDTELEKLQLYSWPGNIRELKNVLERSLIGAHGGAIQPSELIGATRTPDEGRPRERPSETVIATLEEVERRHIIHALERFSGNITQAARALGVSISTLKRKKQLYGLG
jgi:transcriptional regulator with PAS, ATPase and Fis domain